MGLLELASDAIKDLPVSEVIRERLSLAIDQSKVLETQVGELQAKIGGFQAQLERERLDHEQTKKELQRLQELMREEVRFVLGVEFRKGSRTGDVWQPFCPKCHLPVVFSREPDSPVYCQDHHGCRWVSIADSSRIERESRNLI